MLLKQELDKIVEEDIMQNVSCMERDLAGKKVVLYGCGNMGMLTLDRVRDMCEVVGIIDQNAEKAKYYQKAVDMKIPVFRLGEESEEISAKKNSLILLVCICMKHKDFCEFKAILENYGYKNIYYSRMYSYQKIGKDSVSEIKKAFELLEDEESRELYLQLLKSAGGIRNIMNSEWEKNENDQYFPGKNILPQGYYRFVDCGAYIGDTIERIIDRNLEIEEVVAFEPAAGNFKILQTALNSMGIKHKKAYPYAIGKEDGMVSFDDGLDDGCCVSETGRCQIKLTSLDSCIKDFRPTFIKMDIEGAELDAIEGAKCIIEREKPDLAICVYHQFDHLWKISNLIYRICPSYKFYMRCYGFEGGETVLYASVGEL